MTFPSNQAAAESRPRPTTVSVSSYLLWATAALSALGGILEVSVIGDTSEVYRSATQGTDAEGTEAIVVGITVVGVVIGVVFAAALAILAIFNNRGRNAARITTWVLGGISICCTGVGLAGSAVSGSINMDTGNGPTQREIEQQLSDTLPSWYTPVTVALGVITMLTLLGAVILLALPASNAFFRAPQQTWDPSMAYPYPGQPQTGQPPYPQPGYPGQPGHPGQPYPGQPGYPPHPGQQPADAPGGQPAPDGPPSAPPASDGPPPAPPASDGPSSAPPPAGPADGGPSGSGPSDTGPAAPPSAPDADRKPPSDPA
ncbi:hypothetical protein [Jidongwangia harbinensis]|uniref:hypothetical protein n=1 Tax=Jidongwangia harbinensis TaxID=2878561 RepID=UPI001CD9E4FA|nr:hypothetical protein [Jidongwangia harbinensis]MCA2212850.1 hypothetical protein [Jidongwangia harbinensis]